MTAADVMDASGALLNDTALSVFSYANQIPYLNIAVSELRELLELNNIAVSNKVSAVLAIAVGVTELTYSTTPALPSDLIEIQEIHERPTGSNQDYIPMTRMEFLPLFWVTTSSLVYWSWQNQAVKLLGATISTDIKIQYIADAFPIVASSTTTITLINSKSFLSYRTAGLCAEFIGENPSRAQELNRDAQLALDRTLGISVKGAQSISTRRRPFLAGFKSRGY